MARLVAVGELSAKTVNNSRTCLSMTLNETVRAEIDYVPRDDAERFR